MGRLLRKDRLKGVDNRLIKLLDRVAPKLPFDLLVVEGLRTYARQKEFVERGLSRTYKSKHLAGLAVDVAPQKGGEILWENKAAFKLVRKNMLETAKGMGIKVRTGSDWDMNGVIDEEEIAAYVAKIGRKPLVDYPHWELV